jgi:hypothetical protein
MFEASVSLAERDGVVSIQERAMPNSDLHWLTIAEAARLIERRRLSPVELTDALTARIETLDPQLNAFLML